MAAIPFAAHELHDRYRAALIHEARQPLFALQNYIFAAAYILKPLSPSPELELMHSCLTEMQSSIERLSACITKITDCDSKDQKPPLDIIITDFLRETFHLANSVLRQDGIRIQWHIHPGIQGTLRLNTTDAHLTLIRGIHGVCATIEQPGDASEQIVCSAEPAGDDVRLNFRCANHEQAIMLGSVVLPMPKP